MEMNEILKSHGNFYRTPPPQGNHTRFEYDSYKIIFKHHYLSQTTRMSWKIRKCIDQKVWESTVQISG